MDREYTCTKDGKLYFDGCDCVSLAEEFGTPVYVYSQSILKDRIRELKQSFTDGRPKNRKPVRLTFKSVEEQDGIVWMRYLVDG